MDQEDIAQGVWAKLAARPTPPASPEDWIFAVARNDVFRHGRRESRRRAWTAAATELRTAVSPRPFDIDQAIRAVRPRLSEREDEIMVAALTSRTDQDLATTLGYPTVKVAQTVRARLRTRIRDIVRDEVDVTFMYELMDLGLKTPLGEPRIPSSQSAVMEDGTEDPSTNYERATLERVRAVEALMHSADGSDQSDLFGSYTEYFQRAVGSDGNRALWGRALGLSDDELDRLATGRRLVLEVDPDVAVFTSLLLGLPPEDAAGLALADVGLRPIMGSGEANLKDEVLPAEEARLRIRAMQEEDKLLRN